MNVKLKLFNSWVIDQMEKIPLKREKDCYGWFKHDIADLSLDHGLYCWFQYLNCLWYLW